MCDAVTVARKTWAEFEQRCYENIGRVANGFATYSGIPADRVEYQPLDREPEQGSRYSVIGATHFDADDGYWHTGLCVPLLNQPILIPICVTECGGTVTVKFGLDGKPRQLDLNNESQCNTFYDEIVENIKLFFIRGTQSLGGTPTLKKIGFDSNVL